MKTEKIILENLSREEIIILANEHIRDFSSFDVICYNKNVKLRYIYKNNFQPWAVYINGKHFGSYEQMGLQDILLGDIQEYCRTY